MTGALTEDNNKESQIPRKSDNNNTYGPESTLPNSSIEHESPTEFWTIECFVDEVLFDLIRVKETVYNNGKEISVRKYYRQARELIYRIPVWKPSPAFIICISDLTLQLKTQIEQLITSPDNLRYVYSGCRAEYSRI